MMDDVASIVAHFARVLGDGDSDAELAAALACHATQCGHVCADLDQDAGWGPWAAQMNAAARDALRQRLPSLAIVGARDDASSWTPLVWDGRRLWLRRYRDHEIAVARDLRRRAGVASPDLLQAASPQLQQQLQQTFSDEQQRAAAAIALTRRLCLVSGGPGSGKTHTLARIIALTPPATRLALAAPTGKAAGRMGEALRAAGVDAAPEPQTLHRLLGARANGDGFYHHEGNPLAVDMLVIDEASMIDLSMMRRLLAALPAAARLIMLGDHNQLAAVEAGAVFADLCSCRLLAPCVANLGGNFRFGGVSGVGRLARALRDGDAQTTLQLLAAGDADLQRSEGGAATLLAAARSGYQPYLEAVAEQRPASAIFAAFADFRVLCAHRNDAGMINAALTADAGGPAPAVGSPLLVVRNDASSGVFNGDIGIVLVDPADGCRKACFEHARGLRWIPLARLPAWRPAWAMTVHKAQGSEFSRVLLALPATPSPALTRELVYTGVTRARAAVQVHASEAIVRAAVNASAQRMSALRETVDGCEAWAAPEFDELNGLAGSC